MLALLPTLVGYLPPVARSTARVPAIMMRQPWDLPRFVETANFFSGPGEVLKRLLPLPQRSIGPDGLIWSKSRLDLLEWGSLDDVVMGGASQSKFSVVQDVGVWAGTITTENNGGFAGCRSRAVTPALDLSSFKGIRLRVKGDGKRYKLIVRGSCGHKPRRLSAPNLHPHHPLPWPTDDYNWNGIAWAFFFDTAADASDWQDIEAPFNECVPTLFARRVPGVRLNSRSITTVQLTLSKFEVDTQLNPKFDSGPFRLELQSVQAF
jgi:hypothetical protein